MVFTSDGVGVGIGIVSGVVRAFMTLWKSKIGVVRGVISSTESEESERFHFLLTPLMIKWKPNCRSQKQKWKDRPITMHVSPACYLHAFSWPFLQIYHFLHFWIALLRWKPTNIGRWKKCFFFISKHSFKRSKNKHFGHRWEIAFTRMMPRNKKCAVNSNYSMTSWQTPSDIIQLSSEEEVNSGGCTDRDAIYGEGGSVYLVLWTRPWGG